MDVDVFDSKPSPQGSSSTSPISYFCPLLAVRGPASISARRTPRGREGAPDTRRRDAGAAAWGAARRLGSPDPRRPGDRRRGASRGGRPGSGTVTGQRRPGLPDCGRRGCGRPDSVLPRSPPRARPGKRAASVGLLASTRTSLQLPAGCAEGQRPEEALGKGRERSGGRKTAQLTRRRRWKETKPEGDPEAPRPVLGTSESPGRWEEDNREGKEHFFSWPEFYLRPEHPVIGAERGSGGRRWPCPVADPQMASISSPRDKPEGTGPGNVSLASGRPAGASSPPNGGKERAAHARVPLGGCFGKGGLGSACRPRSRLPGLGSPTPRSQSGAATRTWQTEPSGRSHRQVTDTRRHSHLRPSRVKSQGYVRWGRARTPASSRGPKTPGSARLPGSSQVGSLSRR